MYAYRRRRQLYNIINKDEKRYRRRARICRDVYTRSRRRDSIVRYDWTRLICPTRVRTRFFSGRVKLRFSYRRFNNALRRLVAVRIRIRVRRRVSLRIPA